MGPTCLPCDIGPSISLVAWSLAHPWRSRVAPVSVGGLQHAPVSAGKGWLFSCVPLGEEEGRTGTGLDLSAHPYAHQRGGQRSFKSCSVTLDEDGGCESLICSQKPRSDYGTLISPPFFHTAASACCARGAGMGQSPAALLTPGATSGSGVSMPGCGVGEVSRSLICGAGGDKSNPLAGGIQADKSAIAFPGLHRAVLLLQPQRSLGRTPAFLLVGT